MQNNEMDNLYGKRIHAYYLTYISICMNDLVRCALRGLLDFKDLLFDRLDVAQNFRTDFVQSRC
jgi:hypothetical protein